MARAGTLRPLLPLASLSLALAWSPLPSRLGVTCRATGPAIEPAVETAGPTPYDFSLVDLSTCSRDEAQGIATVFARGFYQRAGIGEGSASLPDDELQLLVTAKMTALMTHFRPAPDQDDKRPLLPSVMVVARSGEGELVGCASMLGCVKVQQRKEMGGSSQLLSGREVLNVNDVRELAGEDLMMAPTTRQAAMLADVAVVHEARRQGVARQLCERCLEVAETWEAKEVLLLVDSNNLAARRLYKDLGFIEEGTRSLATESIANVDPSTGKWSVDEIQVTNLLLSRNLRQAKPTKFKLGATTRKEETLRKQQIGHVIPVVVLAGLVGLGSNLGM